MRFAGSPTTKAEKLAMGLQSYLYDRLVGKSRNAMYGAISAPPSLPRDVLKSASKLATLVGQAENIKGNHAIITQVAEVEGKIMIAQAASFLAADAADQALAILDQIKDELLKDELRK